MKHSSNSDRPGFGENLAGGSGNWPYLYTTPAAVKMWYDEVKYFNFRRGGFTMKTGHFTQVVWKRSTKLGCGHYKSNIVCRYGPPGNYRGQYR